MHFSTFLPPALSLLVATASAGPLIPSNTTYYGAVNATANSTAYNGPGFAFLERGKPKPPKPVEKCLPNDQKEGYTLFGHNNNALGFRHWAEPNCPCDKKSFTEKIEKDKCHTFKHPGATGFASFTYKLPSNKALHGCDIKIFNEVDCFGKVVYGLSGVRGETQDGDGRNRACMPMSGGPERGMARSVYVGPCVKPGTIAGEGFW